MLKIIFTFGIGLLLQTFTYAQVNVKGNGLADAVANLERAVSPDYYCQLEKSFLEMAERDSSQWLPWYYAAYCEIRMGFLLKENEAKNQACSVSALRNIKKAESRCPVGASSLQAEIYNVYSMAYRVLIAAKPMVNGRKYGSTANEYLEKALRLSPQNPRSLYLSGQLKYLTPALFGGDKKKAKQLLIQALQSFDKQKSSPVLPHWGRRDCELLISKLN
ncbi:MAG: hypothetical protein ABJA32_05140 [Ginsengibacter sp.]